MKMNFNNGSINNQFTYCNITYVILTYICMQMMLNRINSFVITVITKHYRKI